MAQNELIHYGIKGMKWGVRRKRVVPSTLTVNKSDSAVTKRVKNDYNTMDDQQFMRKYSTSKKTYARRVEKHGDPYMKSPLAKIGKKIDKKQARNEKMQRAVKKGAKKVTNLMTKVGMYYITDQLFWGGMGTKMTKDAVKYTGRAVITAYMKSRGAWDIHWYDN